MADAQQTESKNASSGKSTAFAEAALAAFVDQAVLEGFSEQQALDAMAQAVAALRHAHAGNADAANGAASVGAAAPTVLEEPSNDWPAGS